MLVARLGEKSACVGDRDSDVAAAELRRIGEAVDEIHEQKAGVFAEAAFIAEALRLIDVQIVHLSGPKLAELCRNDLFVIQRRLDQPDILRELAHTGDKLGRDGCVVIRQIALDHVGDQLRFLGRE